MPELCRLKAAKSLKSPAHSKNKQRPWAAKPIELNKEAPFTQQLRSSIDKSKDLYSDNRSSVREGQVGCKELTSYNS